MKLISKWCECGHHDKMENIPTYFEDGKCDCGINKHHYHCTECGKVVQIG